MGFSCLWKNKLIPLFRLWTIDPSVALRTMAGEGTAPLRAAGSSLVTSFLLRFPAHPQNVPRQRFCGDG